VHGDVGEFDECQPRVDPCQERQVTGWRRELARCTVGLRRRTY